MLIDNHPEMEYTTTGLNHSVSKSVVMELLTLSLSKKIARENISREMFPTVMNTAEDAIYQLNWIKDEVESEENVTMMERYTAQLKELE